MTKTLKLAVFGAAGVTGQQVVRQAIARGHRVRAMDRSWQNGPEMPFGVETVAADVLTDDLDACVAGCDAVISTMGLGFSLDTATAPPPIYTEGTRRLVAAMQRGGVQRLLVISASFVASRDRGPLWFRMASAVALDRVFAQMAEMERILAAADGIDCTAVRPGWLMEGDVTADYTVTADVIPDHLIRTRHADLAHFLLYCTESGDWIGRTPAIARNEPDSASSPDKLLSEILG